MPNDIDSPQKAVAENAIEGQVQGSYDREEGIGILDLLLILAARKGLILGLTLVGGIVAAIIAFRTPPTYTATAVIMPPQQQSSSAAALLGQLGGAAGFAGQSFGIKNSSDVYIGILNSRTIADKLIKQFDLQDVYGTKVLTDARKILANRTSFDSKKYSLIQISVVDRDPKRAANLANGYIEQLQKMNGKLAMTEASQRRFFFERQLEAEKDQLTKAEAALKQTQEQKGIFQVNSQVEAVIRSIAQIRAEITAREVNMQRLKAGATTQNPEVLRQEIELRALRSQLMEYEAKDVSKSAGDPFLPTSMVPAAGLEYSRRLREVKYHETLFELLAKQYELARMDEANESPSIQVVDQAIPPDRKSAPARVNIVIMGIVLGGFLGVFLTFIAHAIANLQDASKLVALKKSFWLDRGKASTQ